MKITGLHEFRAYIIETEDEVYSRTDSTDWDMLVGLKWAPISDSFELEELFQDALETDIHTITEGYPWDQE